ncbi:MAG: hybrid sensor histidine kinase/response regulator [Cyanobacteria bacterium J06633_2]
MTSKIVLLVDDNPTNLEVLFEALDQSGLRLLVAEDGEEALERVEYVKPDIILMDVMMPCMDGFEACRRLKSQPETASIPVIFMTALNETSHKLEGLSIGGVDYITKPIDPDEVLARVNIHLSLRDAQIQLYDQNQLLKQEVERRQRIEQSLKLLVRTVSHDLRNPVTGLLLVLKGILNQPSTHQSLDQHASLDVIEPSGNTLVDVATDTVNVNRSILERIVVSATHQLELINSLLETHSLDPAESQNTLDTPSDQSENSLSEEIVLHHKSFYFHQLVDYVVSDVQPLVESNGDQLFTDIPSTLPSLEGDMSQLWRVLENLITNAVKHNSPGVSITITAEQVDAELICKVRDDGQGISADDCLHLFEPYHRAQSQQKTPGLGLGLYLCRQIIEAHGGQIKVFSELGAGATFQFVLPISS